MERLLRKIMRALGYRIERREDIGDFPVLRPLDRNGIDILADPEFQSSCRSVGATSLLDTPRLANLWQICRMTEPTGAMMEIGTYRGGGALHMSNCCPNREIIVCDPFSPESFEQLDSQKDWRFSKGLFADTNEERVRALLTGRNMRMVRGYFPESVRDLELPPISFVHLDVDVYKATRDSLRYLFANNRLCRRSLLVLDDYRRQAHGVDEAVEEVIREVPGVMAFPLFPGQALVVPPTWTAI